METICIRCAISFDSDSWEVDLCPKCELELGLAEKGEQLETELDESDWDSDDF